MDEPSRLPGFYPATPLPSTNRYNPLNQATPNEIGQNTNNSLVGTVGRSTGGPIRRTPAQAISRARAHSTPYARPQQQSGTPGSGNRPSQREEEDDEDEVCPFASVRTRTFADIFCKARIKKGLGEKTVQLVSNLVSGVKDWFSTSKTPRREYVQSVVPRKRTPQRSMTSRMEEGFDNEQVSQPSQESENMFSPSLAPHYAGHTPYDYLPFAWADDERWIVKQRANKGVLATEPPLFPLPDITSSNRGSTPQSKYATLPAKRSNALVPLHPNKRARQSSSIHRPLRDWELSKDRFAEQDRDTIEWCDKYGIDIVALAQGLQKRPPLPSFAEIQRFDVFPSLRCDDANLSLQALRNDVAFFERQGIRYVPRNTRKQSSLRHATSSYELSRVANENPSILSGMSPTSSTSSKLHAWRELLRLKEARQKAELEAAQLERSKLRNGYPPSNHGSLSRSSSRLRGPAGIVDDDVWILPSLKAGSARGSRRRTQSPGGIDGGSWRSAGGSVRERRSRPRGRDVFGTPEVQEVDEAMVDSEAPALLMPPPAHEPTTTNATDGASPRRKRPGYFSAREEDLDPLEMDIDDFVIPARKKQRLSIDQITRGPKFAALWEPARRDNWPLRADIDDDFLEEKKVDELERPDLKELERVREELKDLESPAFKLPPSARKQNDVQEGMHVDEATPTKVVEKEVPGFEMPSSPPKQESGVNGSHVSPQPSPTKENSDFKFAFGKQPTPVQLVTHHPQVPEIEPPTFNFKASTSAPSFGDFTKPGPTPVQEGQKDASKGRESPSKTSSFMETILSQTQGVSSQEPQVDKSAADTTASNTENAQSQSTQSTVPSFSFASPSSLEALPGFSQPTNGISEAKPAVNGGFKFGGDNALPSFGAKTESERTSTSIPSFKLNASAPSFSPIPKEPESKPEESVKFTFGTASKPAEAAKPVEPKPVIPSFPFGTPANEEPKQEPAPPSIPVFGSSGSLGTFGSAFNKPTNEESTPAFGVASTTAPTETTADAVSKPAEPSSAPAAAPFGSLGQSGFTFGQPSPAPLPSNQEAPKDTTSQPATQAALPPQDLDDSMDITDSPPAQRHESISMRSESMSDAPQSFEAFKLPPTSAPTPTGDPSKSLFSFGTASTEQVNGTAEKPAFSFGAPKDEPKPAFTAPSPVSAFGATSTTSGFGGFGSAFQKKEQPTVPEQPKSAPPFSFNVAPATAAPIFGSSTAPQSAESAPVFGTQPSASVFGSGTTPFGSSAPAFNSQTQSSVTSPPATNAPNTTIPSFSFAFNAPSSANTPFGVPTMQPVASPSPFSAINSAPVSPQNQQLPFPATSTPFGGPQPSTAPTQPIFGAAAPPAVNFTFGANLPQSPVFNLGSSQMQRSSSDAGPTNVSPTSRRIAQPRRRLPRR